MKKSEQVLNVLLVDLFNDILKIEQKSLTQGNFSDLSLTEVHTLEAIGLYDSKTMSEVASKLEITVGTLTTAINKLIKKGYVERKRIEEDRRVVMVQLTKKGKLVYRVHEKFHSDMIKSTIDCMSEEEEKVLISSLEKLNIYFKEMYKI
ncbi:MAG: MarR family transcriptional regulator [Clostridiaceae bacterium]|nr:MarR family transcriptional regulator [Clostridiaceae bacterium]